MPKYKSTSNEVKTIGNLSIPPQGEIEVKTYFSTFQFPFLEKLSDDPIADQYELLLFEAVSTLTTLSNPFSILSGFFNINLVTNTANAVNDQVTIHIYKGLTDDLTTFIYDGMLTFDYITNSIVDGTPFNHWVTVTSNYKFNPRYLYSVKMIPTGTITGSIDVLVRAF